MTARASEKGRRTLLLIAGIPLIVVAAATALWLAVESGRLDLVGMLGTANKGKLLDPPVDLENLSLTTGEQEPFRFNPEEDLLWRLLMPAVGGCNADCQHRLWYARQIHTAMGKYRNRIERVLLASDADRGSEWLASVRDEYPAMAVVFTASPALLLGREGHQTAAWFVVDPRGWAMLSYAPDTDGKDIMSDLKFLLKNSPS